MLERGLQAKWHCPQLRCVHESRTIPGHTDVERMVPMLIDALTRPLTAEEQKRGTLGTSPDKRILFEGTLEKAQDFYEQTEIIPTLADTPLRASIPTACRSAYPPRNGWPRCSRAPATSRMN